MATDQLIARDAVIRQTAFHHVRGMESRDLVLNHEEIARGFMSEGQRWPLWNPQRGIFKPRGIPFLLSIRTVFPRKGGHVWYDDQRHVHQQIFAGEEELDSAFMGTDPSAPDNVWLREAAERQIPLIYFLASPRDATNDLRRGLAAAAADPAHRVRRARRCYCHGHSIGRGRAPLRPSPGQATATSGIPPGQRACCLRALVRYQQRAG